jgi:hypothetical protein
MGCRASRKKKSETGQANLNKLRAIKTAEFGVLTTEYTFLLTSEIPKSDCLQRGKYMSDNKCHCTIALILALI